VLKMKLSQKISFVLEIGAGMGENTKFLLATEAKVCATDISEYSLSVIEKRFNNDKLTTKVADMEFLYQASVKYFFVNNPIIKIKGLAFSFTLALHSQKNSRRTR
jgi:16S rRNA A1518/A1519 N6-dimethyltransferase RsmA/KsgA/DIM1 with predicted DNA glycosylase/AP lyase activity